MRRGSLILAVMLLGAPASEGQDTTVHNPGGGVTLPTIVKMVKPAYTPEARAAKIEGTVLVDAVVVPDGTVGAAKVARSLDAKFGLDEQAIKAAKQWLFKPGTRDGEPVAVRVTIELSFTLPKK